MAGQVELSAQVITLLNPVPAQRAWLLLAQGDASAAVRWSEGGWSSAGRRAGLPQEPAYLALVWVLLAQNDPGPVLALLGRMLDAAATQGRTGSIIEIQALRVLGAFAEAVTLACPRGSVRVFADEGASMRALLARLSAARQGQQAPARGINAGYLASCAHPARRTPCRRRSEPPPHRRAWPSC